MRIKDITIVFCDFLVPNQLLISKESHSFFYKSLAEFNSIITKLKSYRPEDLTETERELIALIERNS